MLTRLRNSARALKREAYALSIAVRDPRVPWYARVVIVLVLAYTFSPIDLIPDFIPVLGYLDDLVVTPLGIALALRMIPRNVMDDARQNADDLMRQEKPISQAGAAMVIAIWVIVLAALGWTISRAVAR